MEPFTLIERTSSSGPHHLYDDVLQLGSAKTADHDLQYVESLRKTNPDMIVTVIPLYNVNLRGYAASGHASCELDTDSDSYASWRGYVGSQTRNGTGSLAEQVHFARYTYKWGDEYFILYTVGNVQYVLKEKHASEHVLGPSKITDKLILAIGEWQASSAGTVFVYDQYWQRSQALYKEVERASWDKVILDENMKNDLTSVTDKFFDSRDVYEDLGVPWKRGLIFGGPPGNGKTISIKALMHTLLFDRKDPIPTLYVKSAPRTYDIRNVFQQARHLAPCMLVLEDIETIVTPATRSYFFNEMDGLENNDGLFVVASTNFLDRLDPGLSKRPSRFDRKYIFPLPNEHERTLYCEYWRRKLRSKPKIEFPKMLCPAMAGVTEEFSFAFLQECFVATLLILARQEISIADEGGHGKDLDDYELWRTFREQAALLKKEIKSGDPDSTVKSQDPALAGLEGFDFNAFLDEVPAPPSGGSSAGALLGGGGCVGAFPSGRGVADAHSRLEQAGGDGKLPELPQRKQDRINTSAYMKE